MSFFPHLQERLQAPSVPAWPAMSRSVALVAFMVGALATACIAVEPAPPSMAQPTAATGTPGEAVTATATSTFLPLVTGTANAPGAPADLSSLEIYMEKSGCEGPCPVYSVTVHGDGRVVYQGRTCVNVIGEQTGQIAPDQVRALAAAFYQRDFFALQDTYIEDIQDIPATLIRFTLQDHTKQVIKQVYDPEQAPAALADLEAAIDETANTAQWVLEDGIAPDCP